MKFFALILALAVQYAHADTINWTTDYPAALEQAKKENRTLFLCFTGSDWCPWSKKMQIEILSDPQFLEQIDKNLIFVKLDYPRKRLQDEELKKQNHRLYEKFHIKSLDVGMNRGLPAVILLDPNGNKIGELGYQVGGGAPFAKQVADLLVH